MLLSEALMGKVFMVFGAFWVVVLLALYLGLGILTKRYDSAKHGSH